MIHSQDVLKNKTYFLNLTGIFTHFHWYLCRLCVCQTVSLANSLSMLFTLGFTSILMRQHYFSHFWTMEGWTIRGCMQLIPVYVRRGRERWSPGHADASTESKKSYERDTWKQSNCINNGNEPPHDKTNLMACAPSEDSDQPGHPPSLIRVFAVRMKKAQVLSYPLSAQRGLWSDWADAQADLSLRWAHRPFLLVLSRGGSNVWDNSYGKCILKQRK